MIITDIPFLMQDGSIERPSCFKSKSLYYSRVLNIEQVKRPEILVLIGTESFGKIIVSADSKVIGGKEVSNLNILNDELIVYADLNKSTTKLTDSFWTLHESLSNIEDKSKLFKVVHNLLPCLGYILSLNEKDSKICFMALSRIFKSNYKDQLYIRGAGHVEIARALQILGWKIGIHSIYKYLSGASYLEIRDDLPLTIIDSSKNKITSAITELKAIHNISNKTKFYKIQTSNLPIVPTLCGTFVSA